MNLSYWSYKLEKFIQKSFYNTRIEIDNSAFEGCKFHDCVFVYGGGDLSLTNNHLNNVRWEFVGPAMRTLSLISSICSTESDSKQFIEMILSEFGKKSQ